MEWTVLAAAAAAAVGLGVGWWLGRSSGTRALLTAVDRVSDPGSPAEGPLVEDVRQRLEGGWVPKGTERAVATGEAVTRLQAFLRGSIERPLAAGLSGSGTALREGAEQALAAVQDLNFFADRATGERSDRDVVGLVKQVVGEFTEDWKLSIRLGLPNHPIQVHADGEGLMDALYLVLHNAMTFGQRKPVRVTVEDAGPFAKITVQDQGPGFTAEALSRAYDPFYSTSPKGLGLGLPHARTLVERMSGEIHLRNGDGGGVVEISVPRSS